MNDLNLTPTDVANASLYASQYVVKHRHDTQATETRWDLPPYELIEKPATFFVPPALRAEAKTYQLRFTRDSCRSLSCFMNLNHESLCPPRGQEANRPRSVRVGKDQRTYRVCQDACYKNMVDDKTPLVHLTQYVDGECRHVNPFYKKWCLFPESRDVSFRNKIPPFHYDEDTHTCHFTKEYCHRFQTFWNAEKRECYRTKGQEIVEDYLLGQTMPRLFIERHRALFGDSTKKSGEEALPGGDVLFAVLDEGAVLGSVGLKHASARALAVLNEGTIPKVLMDVKRRYDLAVARAAALTLVVYKTEMETAARIFLKAATHLSKAVGAVSWGLMILGFVGMIMDQVDSLELKKSLNSDHLLVMRGTFQRVFEKTNPGVVDPANLMNTISRGELNDEENAIVLEKSAAYFHNLQVNAEGNPVRPFRDGGLTIEKVVRNLLESSANYSEEKFKEKMDRYFLGSALAFAIILPFFLAASV